MPGENENGESLLPKDGEGAAGAGEAAATGTEGAAAGGSAAAGTTGETPPADDTPTPPGMKLGLQERPEDLPPEFWDDKEKAVRVDKLLKSQRDLRNQVSATPKAPETYEVALPEDLTDLQIDQEHPFFQEVSGWAKANNISQDAFNELVGKYGQAIVSQLPDRNREMESLKKEFGDQTDTTLRSVAGWLQNQFGKDEGMLTAAQSLAATADGVRLLNTLRQKAGEPAIPGADPTAGGTGDQSEADLKALMKDPKYWRDKDPATIKKVEEGFKRLYPQ